MNHVNFNELDIAPPAVVYAAARDFAAALAETPQFKAFEQAYEALSKDTTAQQALSALSGEIQLPARPVDVERCQRSRAG